MNIYKSLQVQPCRAESPQAAVPPAATRPSEDLDVSFVSEGPPVSGKFFTVMLEMVHLVIQLMGVMVLSAPFCGFNCIFYILETVVLDQSVLHQCGVPVSETSQHS